jgi:endonuclease/exonuclease/phosphatase family metal-dependent hydrolase
MRGLRPLLVLTLSLSIGAFAPPVSAQAADNGKKVTFMTRNLYFGADLTPVFVAILGGGDVPAAVTDVWSAVRATDFPTRAHALAEEVKDEKPDFIGLQEAALWTLTEPLSGTTTVAYDFVEILRDALEARGMHYDVVVAEDEFMAQAPGYFPLAPLGFMYVGLEDRDVLLVKHGGDMKISNASGHHFTNLLDLGFATEDRGWVQADVTMGQRAFRLVNTHLTNEHPGYRYLQAAELVAPSGPCDTSLPVVLLGDFNSNGNTPDDTGSGAPYQLVRTAGFSDAWLDEHPGDPGLTYGQEPTLTVPTWPSTTSLLEIERVDFVLYRGGNITTNDADVFGKSLSDMYHGLWPSDHAGVAATLRIP